jgi:hypothetical protein
VPQSGDARGGNAAPMTSRMDVRPCSRT